MDREQVERLIQEALNLQERRFTGVIAELRGELHGQRSTKPKLPNIEKFDGSLQMWEVWHPEIKAKLRIDGAALGDTEESKFWYIYGRLDKKVQALVSPQLEAAERDGTYDHQTLFNQLARLCDNPNAKRDAQDKLQSLRQFQNQTFNIFLATFERFLYKAEANKWNDDAKVALLRSKLNDNLKKRLRTQITVPTSYDGFVKVLQQLDDAGRPPFNKSGPSKALVQHGEPMDIGAVKIGALSQEDISSDKEDGTTGHLLYNPKTGGYTKVKR